MAEHKKPKSIGKAKRGGFSLSGFKIFQEKTQMRQQEKRGCRDVRSSIYDPPQFSKKSGSDREKEKSQAPRSPVKQKTSADTQKTLFDIVENTGAPQTAPEAKSPTELEKSSAFVEDNDDSLDAEEDAQALLNRFLRSTSRSNSRPGSSGTLSDVRSSPQSTNPLKRPADAISKDDNSSPQGLSSPIVANPNGNIQVESVSPRANFDGSRERRLTPPINIPIASRSDNSRSPRAESASGNAGNQAPSCVSQLYTTGSHSPSSKGPSNPVLSKHEQRKELMQPLKTAESVDGEKRRIVILQIPKWEPTTPSVVKQKEQSDARQTSPSPSKRSVGLWSSPSRLTIPPVPEDSSPGVTGRPGDAGFTRKHRPSQQHTTNNRKDQFSPSPSPAPVPHPFTCSPLRISEQPAAVNLAPDMPPKRTRNTPARKPRRTSTSTPNSPQMAPDTGVRRSRRNRAGPANYYAPPPGFLGHPEFVEEESTQSPTAAEVKAKQESPPPEPSTNVPKRGKRRVRYKTEQRRIVQEPLDGENYTFENRAPYFPTDYIRDLHQQWWVNVDCGIFHVDFTRDEMIAIHSIVASVPPDEETAIQGLIIKAVQQVVDVSQLSTRIKGMCKASLILEPYSDQLRPFLLEHRQGDFSRSAAISRSEMKKLCKYLSNALSLHLDTNASATIGLQRLLQNLNEEKFDRLADQLLRAKDLRHRKRVCLQAFLEDAKKESIPTSPSIYRLLPVDDDVELDTVSYDQFNTAALLRAREIGFKVHRGPPTIQSKLKSVVTKWEMHKSWKGASNDVLELCWSPDGTRFAAAATAQCDEHNMLYNRNNNLVVGDLVSNRLTELPDHRVPRPPNAQHANTTIDSNLYMTVTAAKWSRHVDRLFTASYDQTVKIWDVQAEAACIKTIWHPGKVHVMALSDGGRIATGCDDNNPFRVLNVSTSGNLTEISSGPTGKEGMTPSSLAWGFPAYGENFLAAGMCGKETQRSFDPPKHGHLAVWKVAESYLSPIPVMPNSQNVFDIRWHPTLPVFATANTIPASARSLGLSKDVRSLVRIYDPTRMKAPSHQFDCPALDMNDVSFCPFNYFYVTANCTDGATYVWDCRKPDTILHKLKHGAPLGPLDPDLTREQADVGVRLALWGESTTQLYTGSSDGVLKLWNILRAREDALVSNVHSFGQEITCGALSSDMNNMLIGDACGSIHVLSNAPWSRAQDGDTSMIYEPADQFAAESSDIVGEEEEEGETARRIAQEMLSTGRIIRHPRFGAMQGPNYDGPFASWARTDSVGDKDLSKLTEQARNQQLKDLPLNPDVKSQQFYGPPIELRRELDKATRDYVATQMQLAEYRNKISGQNKRKRESSPFNAQVPSPKPASKDIIEISSGDENKRHGTPSATRPRKVVKREVPSPKRPGTKIEVDYIDLTMSDEEQAPKDDLEKTLDGNPDDPFEEDYWWPTNVDPNL